MALYKAMIKADTYYMKLIRVLCIILLPITILIMLISFALLSNSFLPDNFAYKLIYGLVKNISFIKTDKQTTLMYVLIAGGIVLIDIIMLILANMSIKDKKAKFLKERCMGFKYIELGDEMTVIAKYEHKRNGYGEGQDEPFGVLPFMFQKLFNNGYTRLLHVEMNLGGTHYDGRRYFIFAKGKDDLTYHEPIIGLNVKQNVNATNPHYVDIVYEYIYRGNGMLVTAEDGTTLFYNCTKKRKH